MGTRVPGARAPGGDGHPLLRSLSDGDESAFWKLWQQYRRHLYAVCLRQMSGDEAEADDAVSRSMMVARDRRPLAGGARRKRGGDGGEADAAGTRSMMVARARLPEHPRRIENLEAWL